ncbi:dystrophin-related protein 2-like [Stegostoma tigrinum]|uniref:dystrophin-related protein 2-like n=1 Tax=Stegostoma tigrinum TaxID=3053191 RepID=UPI0028704547|nr:dystrophin-related protein 2-like [Stegostoma tigrinum]
MGTIELWSWFKEQILRVLDRYVPVRQGGSDQLREPWFTKKIVSLVKQKREADVTMRPDGSHEVMESYRFVRKDLKRELRRARRVHEQTLAESTPEERAQRIAKAVCKQSIDVKENWEQLKTHASNWQNKVEKALEKLQELQKALDDLESHVITAEGVHIDWQPVNDLFIDALQDHMDKTTD